MPRDFDSRYKLTKYLLSTQSILLSALATDDYSKKISFRNEAGDYLQYAKVAFDNLTKQNGLDTVLVGQIRDVISAYQQIIQGPYNKICQPETGFALSLLDSQWKLKILPALWGNK